MLRKTGRVCTVVASSSLLALTAPAVSEDWPVRPMTMVAPFATCGAVDVLGRTRAARVSELLGQQIINKFKMFTSGPKAQTRSASVRVSKCKKQTFAIWSEQKRKTAMLRSFQSHCPRASDGNVLPLSAPA